MFNTNPINTNHIHTSQNQVHTSQNQEDKNRKKFKIVFSDDVLESFKQVEKEIRDYKVVKKEYPDPETLKIKISVDENFNILDVEAFRKDQSGSDENTSENEEPVEKNVKNHVEIETTKETEMIKKSENTEVIQKVGVEIEDQIPKNISNAEIQTPLDHLSSIEDGHYDQ